MIILVIGGTTFLGYHLTRKFLSQGHDVTLFNRGRTQDDFGDRVRRIRGDRYDYRKFEKIFQNRKYDVVVDMIAFKAEDSQSAVRAFNGKVRHFIHISTAAVYTVTGDFPCPLREEDYNRSLHPRHGRNPGMWGYGYNKRKCEEVLSRAYKEHGFPATRFRFPIIIGEKDHTLRAYSYFLRIQDGRPVILPDGGRNAFTHVYQGDIVRTLSKNLLNKTALGKVYNLAQQRAVTLKDFILKSANIMDRKVDTETIPVEIMKEQGISMDFSPFFNKRPFILDTRRAEKDLNYESLSVEEWLSRTVHWYQSSYSGGPPDNYRYRDKEEKLIQNFRRAVKTITP
ncbi:MAG: NAD-dependent epimerase/dehydratase family protein [Candidatus Aminicenantes bacterium]